MHFVWPSTCSETPTKSFPTVRISVCYMYLCRVACPLCVVFVSVPGCVCVSKRMATRFGPRMARITLHHDGHTHSGMARTRSHSDTYTTASGQPKKKDKKKRNQIYYKRDTYIYIYVYVVRKYERRIINTMHKCGHSHRGEEKKTHCIYYDYRIPFIPIENGLVHREDGCIYFISLFDVQSSLSTRHVYL